jgi:hypothetical protein
MCHSIPSEHALNFFNQDLPIIVFIISTPYFLISILIKYPEKAATSIAAPIINHQLQ